MNYKLLLILMVGLLVSSCVERNPIFKYNYNKDPKYTWGYAQFYGKYYADYGINNNVVTLSLFSDSLSINDKG
ncbi:MAG: hypothetical protein Q7U47_12150, partial [Paludibacter sp.]|nr:hypothetical protein [Paludibacter sp.]